MLEELVLYCQTQISKTSSLILHISILFVLEQWLVYFIFNDIYYLKGLLTHVMEESENRSSSDSETFKLEAEKIFKSILQ